jgi:hypothetical protein
MSYELSGLGAVRPSWAQAPKFKRTKLPHPGRTGGMKRRALPHEIMRLQPRLPISAVEASQLTGLGFSLKPPKWVRKLTIKKVLKPLAITAAVVGAAFIPGALPLVGKAAGLLAKGAIGAGKLAINAGSKVGTGFMSMFKKPAAAQGAQTQEQYDAEQAAANTAAQAAANQAAANAQAAANQAAQDAANQAAQRPTGPSGTLGPSDQVPYSPPTYAPSDSGGGGGWSSGGGGGGGAPMTADSPAGSPPESAAPAPAGMNVSSLIPIGVGLIALVAVSGALKRRRR